MHRNMHFFLLNSQKRIHVLYKILPCIQYTIIVYAAWHLHCAIAAITAIASNFYFYANPLSQFRIINGLVALLIQYYLVSAELGVVRNCSLKNVDVPSKHSQLSPVFFLQ